MENMQGRSSRLADKRWFVPVALFAVALAARIALFLLARLWDPAFSASSIVVYDATGYHQRALTVFGPSGFYPPYAAIDYIRPPLFPIFAALIYLVGGVCPWHVLIGNAFIASLTCVALYGAAKDAIGPRAAVLMALVFALDPTLVLASNLLLSEVLFLFFCALALWFLRTPLETRLEHRSHGSLAAAGLCLGLATLTRPVGEFIPVVVLLVLFLIRPRSLMRTIAAAAIVGVVFLGSVTPWILRNRAVFGVPSISVIQEWSPLFLVLVGPVESARTGESLKQVGFRLEQETASLARAEGVDPDALNRFQLARYWHRLLYRYVTHAPLPYVKLCARRSVLFFANAETRSYSELLHLKGGGADLTDVADRSLLGLARDWLARKTMAEQLIGLWVFLWLGLSYVCLAVGLWVALRSGLGPFLLTCLLISLGFMASGIPVGLARFRAPAMMFYLPFIGIGLGHMWSHRPGARGPGEPGARRPATSPAVVP
jgi:4-amino-4-deoxy-L-arabinose transferase-like glycosyltransferase